MKSTYKLIGVFWDRRPRLKQLPPFYKSKIEVRNYDGEYDLFDTVHYVRKINISDLLGIENDDSIKGILDCVKECSEVIISFDYLPTSKFWMNRKFYLLRILQCLEYIRKNYAGIYKKIKLLVKNSRLVKKQITKIMEGE